MQEAHQIRLEIPSATEYVGVVRRAVEGIARRMNFDSSEVEDLKLAVGEACTNAIKHGCPSKFHPFITVICRVDPLFLEIEIRNSLAGGEPCPSVVAPKEVREGGMGLYIMDRVMDEVDITWKDRTAKIRMVKRIKAKT